MKVDKDSKYKPKSRYAPNDVVAYHSNNGNGEKMANITLCDENGYPYKRLHYGHHGNKKVHNFGTKDESFYYHTHDISYDVTGKQIHGSGRKMTDEEVRLLNG